MKTTHELKNAMRTLQKFIGTAQWDCIGELVRGEEREAFQDKLCDLARTVESMPTSYQTDGQGDQAQVWLHYFTSGADFYIIERDVEQYQAQAFGLADLGYGGELGYISIPEIVAAGAELDFYFTRRTLAEVKSVRRVEQWPAGYAGPAPAGVDYSDHLALNNID